MDTSPLVTKRAHYTFPLPARDQDTFDGRTLHSVTMVELTIAEERAASKIADSDGLLHELTKASIRKINDAPATSEEVAVIFAQLRPRQRDLVVGWYRRLNLGSKEDEEAGFKAASISVE